MKNDAFSTIDSNELLSVCGGAGIGGAGGGGGGAATEEQPTPRNRDKRSLNIGYTKDGAQYGVQVSKEVESSNYALCLGQHPHDTKDQCGLPPA
ncbi:MAG TPA: hypothetical protein VIV40_23390 [Kofleriaceae bacterium]